MSGLLCGPFFQELWVPPSSPHALPTNMSVVSLFIVQVHKGLLPQKLVGAREYSYLPLLPASSLSACVYFGSPFWITQACEV